MTDEKKRNSVKELVSFVVDGAIVTAKFRQTVAGRLPEVFAEIASDFPDLPDAVKVTAASCSVFRRLAIVRWGDGEDDGFPMVLDNSDQAHPVWKISMQQWHETMGSSVGDSMLRTNWGPNTYNQTTQDVLDGKIHTAEELRSTLRRRLEEAIEPDRLKRELESVFIALRLYTLDHKGLLPQSLDELSPIYINTEEAARNQPKLIKPGENLDKLPPKTIILEGKDEANRVGQVSADNGIKIKQP